MWPPGTEHGKKRLLDALQSFLAPMIADYRVHDLAAATELIYYAIEEVSHRAILFDSPVGEERLVRALQDMLVRYLFDDLDLFLVPCDNK